MARKPPLSPFLLALGGRVAGWLLLLYLTWCVLTRGLTYERWPGSAVLGIVDGANFFFHEAGHLLFVFFGEFLTMLGGSLSQVLIPAICTAQFLRQRHVGASAAGLFWMGESLTGVALYAADAKARRRAAAWRRRRQRSSITTGRICCRGRGCSSAPS
ncbi:MAG: hypothetical protein HYU41_26755 [Candidatus Rokubacteria bacterium]|nr:hypothetical protein [Candidatus Rokubacteria bacterium]